MKKGLTITIIFMINVVLNLPASAQMMGPGMGRHGMMGDRCPMCGRNWDGRMQNYELVPENLPKPESGNWIDRLRQVLSLEKLSKNQYQADSNKYGLHMPYMMVIPQEDNHIRWINQMFTAYGISANVEIPPLITTNSASDALKTAMGLEQDLEPHYSWLINNAEDNTSAEILDEILLQTRMHRTMFNHALQMGGRMGPGMMRRP